VYGLSERLQSVHEKILEVQSFKASRWATWHSV